MTELTGGCQCGAIRYAITIGDTPPRTALCHCADCRRSAGAPMVGWTAIEETGFRLTQGQPQEFASSENARRYFCATCGTGLYYLNAVVLPGIVDVQTATLDEPEHCPPLAHIQLAERIGWMADAHQLPGFDRFPEG